MVSSLISRYVVSLPPVTVMTPESEVLTLWRRDKSAVRSPIFSFASGFTNGRNPAHTAKTSLCVTSLVMLAFNARRT